MEGEEFGSKGKESGREEREEKRLKRREKGREKVLVRSKSKLTELILHYPAQINNREVSSSYFVHCSTSLT